MPFTHSSALQTAIASDTASLGFAFKIVYQHPVNGATTIGYTTAGIDITLGGFSYLADLTVSPTSMVFELGLVPTKFDISGYFSANGINEGDLLAGMYDFADVFVYLFDWSAPTTTPETRLKGKLGELRVDGNRWSAEVSDLIDQLTQNIVEYTSPTCRVDLGSARCKVRMTVPSWAAATAYTATTVGDAAIGSWIKPATQNRRWYRCTTTGTSGGSEPSWGTTVGGTTADNGVVWTAHNAYVLTGFVTSKTDDRLFADSTITEANNFWQFGKVVWITGANAGRQMEIKSQTGTIVELYLPMVSSIVVGDEFQIHTGCDKAKAACKTKFLNLFNMQAEPDKPSNALLTQYGNR